MKKIYLAFFLAGTLFGAAIIFALYNYGTPPATSTESQQILDDVIQEWTALVDAEKVMIAGRGGSSKRGIFQLGKIPDTVRVLAAIVDSIYKIPKGVICAQFILESKWGLCSLGAENYFGHTYAATKKYLKNPQYVIRTDRYLLNGKWTKRQMRFSRYQDLAECFLVHGMYLSVSPLYRDAFNHVNSPELFARIIAKKYAADPDYAIKLITLMRRYQL
ncbi:MAG: glucosaminidase domain-containing protein [Bacteroidales bacterium]|nr:glucosaminidase domain-containing protein [Bacteroidales bacterium]